MIRLCKKPWASGLVVDGRYYTKGPDMAINELSGARDFTTLAAACSKDSEQENQLEGHGLSKSQMQETIVRIVEKQVAINFGGISVKHMQQGGNYVTRLIGTLTALVAKSSLIGKRACIRKLLACLPACNAALLSMSSCKRASLSSPTTTRFTSIRCSLACRRQDKGNT